jgi:ethanolamine utilization protein EutA
LHPDQNAEIDDPLAYILQGEYEPMAEGDHALWMTDLITLTSVGIDIGTATSQILFSRLELRRLGAELSSRYVVVNRETLYLSPVHLTPYTPGREHIDDQALGKMVDQAYTEAGLTAEQVDTGAVILTGEAIRRDNARAIADLFAAQRGDFVCATAGHHFEALLAAHGSGTIALTEGKPGRLLNIDIGGGTTKLSLVEHGKVLETSALHVGGRLIAVDEVGRLKVLEPGGEKLARAAGFDWKVGEQTQPDELANVASYMADAILRAVRDDPPPPEVAELFVTPLPSYPRNYDGVVFSGGVGEYVYRAETQSYGDMGQPLGAAIRSRFETGAFPWPLLGASECIRATVMGASQYSVQVSGNTIYSSDEDAVLPQRNVQVLRPHVDLSAEIDPETIARAIVGHYRQFDIQEGESKVALVFEWSGDASFERVNAFADGLFQGIPKTLTDGDLPIVLVFDQDIGGIVGSLIKLERKVKNEVLSIDGVTLTDFDFIDIGSVLQPSGTVPVTIKSLVFQM